MPGSTLKSGLNYFSTFLLLVRDHIAFLGRRAIPIIAGVVAASVAYPLPFAIMAVAIYAMMGADQAGVVTLPVLKVEVDIDSVFLYAVGFAVVTLTLQYFAIRAALTSTTSWQDSLLWRVLNQLPAMARWDTETAVPLPLNIDRLGPFLTTIVRSGALIGRMIAIGMSDLAIAVAALCILMWLDPISTAVLVALAIPFMPVYAWALRSMIGVRSKQAREHPREKAMLRQVLDQGVLSNPERRIDTSRLSAADAGRFASGYRTVNDQLQGLNLVRFVAGLQVFSSIAVIYLVNGASLSAFVRDKIVFFVVLIFMLKAVLSLVSLMSRLSRNYGRLAVLRAYLHPKRKRTDANTDAPTGTYFAIDRKQAERHFIQAGTPAFVIMPKAVFAFELLPLSNALKVVAAPRRDALRHIVFFDEADVEAFVSDGAAPRERPAEIEIPGDKQSLTLPVHHVSLAPEQLFAVALSLPAWTLLVGRNLAEKFCANRIVFVVLGEPQRPEPVSPGALLIVSDGVEITAVGPFAETWDSFAEGAFRGPGNKVPKVDFEDDEEEG